MDSSAISLQDSIPTATDDSGFVDLHADTPLHGLPLDAETADPTWGMKLWMNLTKPVEPNFCRQITGACLDRRGSGIQIFSIVTEGFPPFYRASHRFYSHALAGRPLIADATRFNSLIDQIAWIYRETEKAPTDLTLATCSEESKACFLSRRIGIWIGLEGASPLIVKARDEAAFHRYLADPDCPLPPGMPVPTDEEVRTSEGRVSYLARAGVLYVGLNHLNSNRYAGSDFPLALPHGRGLSDEGRELVRQLNAQGILVDAAHASRQAQRDLIGVSTLPVLVSHGIVADQRGVIRSWRTTEPELLEEIRRTGGLFGVMFARNYLDEGTAADVVDQIDAVREAIGIDHIAFGSDADGFVGMAVADMDVTPILTEMRARGYTDEEIRKVRYDNFLRMLAVRDERLAVRQKQAAPPPER